PASVLQDLRRLLQLLVVVGAGHLLGGTHQPEHLLASLEAGGILIALLPGPTAFAPLRRSLLAGLSERIDLAALDLLRRDQPLVLEQLERGVDRAGAGGPTAAGALLELLNHLVAMHGPIGEQREDSAADVASANPMATSAPHLVPPESVAASLSMHLRCSFRSIMN